MKKIIRLTEKDLTRIVKRVITEQAAAPAAAPATAKTDIRPSVSPIYGAAGTSTVTFTYDTINDLITVQGSAKMPDGTYRALVKYSDIPQNIQTIVTAFMSRNGFEGKQPKLKQDLETKLTELKGKIDTFKKSKPTQQK
jgi:hypothetical protein